MFPKDQFTPGTRPRCFGLREPEHQVAQSIDRASRLKGERVEVQILHKEGVVLAGRQACDCVVRPSPARATGMRLRLIVPQPRPETIVSISDL